YSTNEMEFIEQLDKLFRQAVKRAFLKDKEYGLDHVVALSGGLDSRMLTWVAHDLGYTDILNFTFSQSNYLDEKIAKRIATDLNHEWIFKALDGGNYLKYIEEMIVINFALSSTSGLSLGKELIDSIDHDKFGIYHTGDLGDVILGTFYPNNYISPYVKGTGGYSMKLLHRIKDVNHIMKYENEEIFKFYTRGFNANLVSLIAYQQKNEAYSPFCDIDFFEYAIKIPVELRFKHQIYFKWILSKYPEAANYKWEKINAKITDKTINIKGKRIPLKQFPSRVFKFLLHKIVPKRKKTATPNHMNPHDYWYSNNNSLKEFINRSFSNNIQFLTEYPELHNDCIELFKDGSVGEKLQVLDLLVGYKFFFK
ncbi:MAG: asparagine synthase-related protein, partial [Candidatus Hodarchaeales archaeon]